MEKCFLSIGSNLGDRKKNLESVAELLGKKGIKVIKSSRIYQTEPVGFKDQEWFFNQVLEIETELEPHKLLAICQDIEKEIGRVKTFRWGPRVIDIDILLCGDLKINDDSLTIPHPRIFERKFVLLPLVEIAPDFEIVTGTGAVKKTIKELLNACGDTAIVRPL